MKVFRTLPVLQEGEKILPSLTPPLRMVTLKSFVPAARGEPGSLRNRAAEPPRSAGTGEEMQLSLE